MRVIVTGATSFIGKAVTKELLAGGHHVFAVVRPDSPGRGLKSVPSIYHTGGKFATFSAHLPHCPRRRWPVQTVIQKQGSLYWAWL